MRDRSTWQFLTMMVATSVVAAPLVSAQISSPARILIVTDDPTSSGGLLEMVSPVLVSEQAFVPIPVDGGAIVRRFKDLAFVVNPQQATVQIVDLTSWQVVSQFSVGAGSEPRDIHVVSKQIAYVTRRNRSTLYRVDPSTGLGYDVVDLSVVADPDGIPEMMMMAEDRGRLFIQLQLEDTTTPDPDPLIPEPCPLDPGALAVFDLASEQLIDAEPWVPGLQAIALEGTRPRFRMSRQLRPRVLLVTAAGTDANVETCGGLEMVDLDALTSLGFGRVEIPDSKIGVAQITQGNLAWSIDHTDITQSNHLALFDLSTGTRLLSAVDTPGLFIRALGYDALRNLLFYPSTNQTPPGGGTQGIMIYNATTGAPLTRRPIPTVGIPVGDLELYLR